MAEKITQFETLLQRIVADCKNCGYKIRIGSKEVKKGEKYKDAVNSADKAVSISKENQNLPVRTTKEDKTQIQETPFASYTQFIPEITTRSIVKIHKLTQETKKGLDECS